MLPNFLMRFLIVIKLFRQNGLFTESRSCGQLFGLQGPILASLANQNASFPFLLMRFFNEYCSASMAQGRRRLHDEFRPGLKFQPAPRAEILLRLHDYFLPGLKFQIGGKSERPPTFSLKHNH